MSNAKSTRYRAYLVYEDGNRYAYGCDGTDWYALLQADEALAKDSYASHCEIVEIQTSTKVIGVRSRGMGKVSSPRSAEEHDAIMREGMAAK
jgi:hypothetical protein